MNRRGVPKPNSRCPIRLESRLARPLGNRGQASLMMGMMMLTFILLFAFVVNTGMLVSAKINLQNAADLAAYSGAAVQARQLNHISFLNYEMKRQYKKFLFRYYVMGNLAYDDAPKTGSVSPSIRQFTPGQGSPYTGPVVCIVFNSSDNFCRLRMLKAINIPKPQPMDMLQTALIENLKNMEELRRKNCTFIGRINRQVLGYWLWNTDPEFDDLASSLPPALQGELNTIRGLAYGMGLIPRELLLKKRIDTLSYYVNFPAQRGVTLARAQGLKSEGDVARRERTIQAFFSAYHTLGNHTFGDLDSIVMDEVEPAGVEGSNYLNLNTVTVNFDTFYADVVLRANGGGDKDCVSTAMPISVPGSVPVAVYKDPSILTYYGVKLTAKAKVLFNPFGSEIELTAYSAAQPFGSRIGPVVDASDFVSEFPKSATISPEGCGIGQIPGCQGRVPNLKLTPQLDWMNNQTMGSMYEQFFKQGMTTAQGDIVESRIDANKMERAYHAAMAPTPIDEGKYNIPDDLQKDGFITYFGNPSGTYGFWAPIQSSDQAGEEDAAGLIGGMLKQLNVSKASDRTSQQSSPNVQNESDNYRKDFLEPLTKSMTTYLQKMKEGKGEGGEGFNIARITDPFHERPGTGASGGPRDLLKFNPPELFLSDPVRLRSSWADLKDGSLGETGRTGYSVKYVSFKGLSTPDTTADGTSVWRNPPRGTDDQMSSDLKKIQH